MLCVRSRRALARKWHRQREEEEDAADRAEEAAERRELPGPPAGAPPFPALAQPESHSAFGGMHRVLGVCKRTDGGESRASSCPGCLLVCRLPPGNLLKPGVLREHAIVLVRCTRFLQDLSVVQTLSTCALRKRRKTALRALHAPASTWPQLLGEGQFSQGLFGEHRRTSTVFQMLC